MRAAKLGSKPGGTKLRDLEAPKVFFFRIKREFFLELISATYVASFFASSRKLGLSLISPLRVFHDVTWRLSLSVNCLSSALASNPAPSLFIILLQRGRARLSPYAILRCHNHPGDGHPCDPGKPGGHTALTGDQRMVFRRSLCSKSQIQRSSGGDP